MKAALDFTKQFILASAVTSQILLARPTRDMGPSAASPSTSQLLRGYQAAQQPLDVLPVSSNVTIPHRI
jgi:hypothetical protein